MPKTNARVQVQGLHLSEYDKLVNPNRRFLIPNYFIYYWLRLLGPTLAWIIITLQQACWEANGNQCEIAQETIAERIGINRRTVIRLFKQHQELLRYYIPHMEYNRGQRQGKNYQPLPNKYTVYLSTPLVPAHLAGLAQYFHLHQADPAAAIDALLQMPGKKALQLIEQHYHERWTFTETLPLTGVFKLATGLDVEAENAPAPNLANKLAGLHTHLTEIGFTNVRQYFRHTWVERLGTTLSWLIIILRSSCYYNYQTGELRDACTWNKTELRQVLGSSRQGLVNQLGHDLASHFFQIVDDNKFKISFRVSMVQDPLLIDGAPEPAELFWARQPGLTAKNVTSPPESTAKSVTSPNPVSAKNVTPVNGASAKNVTPFSDSTAKNVTSSPANHQNCHPLKYYHDSVPINGKDISINNTNDDALVIRSILQQAGLSGAGLQNLCDKQPPITAIEARAAVLEAQAKGMRPGYIYRLLEKEITIAPRFLQLATLGSPTLASFREALTLMQAQGGHTLPAEVSALVPAGLEGLFAVFVEAFGEMDAVDVLARFAHRNRAQPGEPAPVSTPLDRFWAQALDQLQLQMGRETFNHWLKDTRLVEATAERYVIQVKSRFARDWLAHRLADTIRRVVAQLQSIDQPETIALEFVVNNELSGDAPAAV